MNIIFIILSILLEAWFIFIAIKAMKSEKISVLRNALLFFGIVVANLGSGILARTPFKHLLTVSIIFIIIKLLYNNSH